MIRMCARNYHSCGSQAGAVGAAEGGQEHLHAPDTLVGSFQDFLTQASPPPSPVLNNKESVYICAIYMCKVSDSRCSGCICCINPCTAAGARRCAAAGARAPGRQVPPGQPPPHAFLCPWLKAQDPGSSRKSRRNDMAPAHSIPETGS